MFSAMTSLDRKTLMREGGAGLAVAALVVSNLATNRWLPRAAYVPWNLAMTAGLLVMARYAGLGFDELGMDPRRLRKSAQVGAIGTAAVATAYGAMVVSGRADGLFEDRRLASLSQRDALWHLMVRIPLGTAFAEEVAFRGVLPALLKSSRIPSRVSSTIAAVLFGLWHVLPSHEQARANRSGGVGHSGGAVAVAVVTTTLAGSFLHRVGARAGHLAAPIALHLATNGLGLLAVRIVDARR